MQGKAFFAQIYQTSRERSKKIEAVFLVGSRESEGKSKSPQARFLFATFSFGEAKEKVGPQSQICRRLSTLQQCNSFFNTLNRSLLTQQRAKLRCAAGGGRLAGYGYAQRPQNDGVLDLQLCRQRDKRFVKAFIRPCIQPFQHRQIGLQVGKTVFQRSL